MAYSLTWLPKVLKEAGLKVAECPGWQNCGIGDMKEIKGIICHHTATTILHGNMPSLNTIIHGRADLRGPLSHLGLGRDGTYYIIAAGKCSHAGPGKWQGETSGNSHFIGIEAENAGIESKEKWPEIQMVAYRQGVAAILKYLGKDASACAGHREYATPKGRKTDPNFNMDDFRAEVSKILGNGVQPIKPIPNYEPGTASPRPTLRRGISNDSEMVKTVQKKIGVLADGYFGPVTEAKLRVFQKNNGAVPDGIVGPKTWKLLDSI